MTNIDFFLINFDLSSINEVIHFIGENLSMSSDSSLSIHVRPQTVLKLFPLLEKTFHFNINLCV